MGQSAGLILEPDLLARSANWCATCSFWLAFMCVCVCVRVRAAGSLVHGNVFVLLGQQVCVIACLCISRRTNFATHSRKIQ